MTDVFSFSSYEDFRNGIMNGESVIPNVSVQPPKSSGAGSAVSAPSFSETPSYDDLWDTIMGSGTLLPDFVIPPTPTKDTVGTNGNDSLYVGPNLVSIGLGGDDSFFPRPTPFPNGQTHVFTMYGGRGNDTYYQANMAHTVTLICENGNDARDKVVIPAWPTSSMYTVIDGKHLHIWTNQGATLIANAFEPRSKVDIISFAGGVDMNFDTFWASLSSGSFGPRLRAGTFADVGVFENVFQVLNSAKDLTSHGGSGTGGSSGGATGGGSTGGGSGGTAPGAELFKDLDYCLSKCYQLNVGITNLEKLWLIADVQNAIHSLGISTEQHYRSFGAFERNDLNEYGLDPSKSFDTSKYYLWKQSLMQKDGVFVSMGEVVNSFKNAQLDPLTHYAVVGAKEGIQALAVQNDKINGMTEWNEAQYYAANPDVANAVAVGLLGCGFEHYALYGQYEGRSLG